MDAVIGKADAGKGFGCLIISTVEGKTWVAIDDIVAICSDAKTRKRSIVTTTFSVETRKHLVELYEMLPNNRFAYTHQSYIVNMGRIRHKDAATVSMDNGLRLPIGRTSKAEFLERFQAFVANN